MPRRKDIAAPAPAEAMINTESDPGSYIDMMAHSPCLRVKEYQPEESHA